MDRRTDVGQIATKRGLLHVSRLLERWLADEDVWQGDRPVVLALFQDHGYFAASADRYGAMGERMDVVVAFAGEGPVPEGVHAVRLDSAEPLANEWTVVVLGDGVCAALVALDLRTTTPADTLEGGRAFHVDLSCDPRVVTAHARRLVEGLGARLDPAASAAVAAAVGRTSTNVPGRTHAVLGRALESAAELVIGLATPPTHLEATAHLDPLTGCHDRRALERFLHGAGARAPGVSLLAFELDGLEPLALTHGDAHRVEALRAFARIVRARMRPDDIVVRTGDDAFLVLAPGLGRLAAADRAAAVVADVAEWSPTPPAQHRRLGVCAGVGQFDARRVDLAALDDALYRATLAGSGRVEVLPTLVTTA
jgi:diguanylate cyclase (GGDEF)-like protein